MLTLMLRHIPKFTGQLRCVCPVLFPLEVAREGYFWRLERDRACSKSSMDLTSAFLFFHSLLRWALLVAVALAGFNALVGWLRQGPVITWQRSVAIWAMVLCHVQLVIGFILYGLDFNKGIFDRMPMDDARYWKFEHMGMMVLAVALVTIGRLASKRARTEQGKHVRVAIFYLLALAVMLLMIPWPFTAVGDGRGWL